MGNLRFCQASWPQQCQDFPPKKSLPPAPSMQIMKPNIVDLNWAGYLGPYFKGRNTLDWGVNWAPKIPSEIFRSWQTPPQKSKVVVVLPFFLAGSTFHTSSGDFLSLNPSLFYIEMHGWNMVFGMVLRGFLGKIFDLSCCPGRNYSKNIAPLRWMVSKNRWSANVPNAGFANTSPKHDKNWWATKKKNRYFLLNTGCLIGILIMVHYHPHIG